MELSEAVQRALVARLRADPALAALIGDRVFDHVPTKAPMPYVSLGPEDARPIDEPECLSGYDGTVQVDVWSRAPGRIECRWIAARIVALFAHGPLTLAPPHPPAEVRVSLTRIFDEGQQRHAIVQIDVWTDGA